MGVLIMGGKIWKCRKLNVRDPKEINVDKLGD